MDNLMRPLMERAYWWLMGRLYGERTVRGLKFIFGMDEDHVSREELEAVLGTALELVSAAKGGFGELVTSHLRLVAAIEVPTPYASHVTHAYVSAFRGHEAKSSQYLACQLVWAATSIRLSRDALASGMRRDEPTISLAAYEAQLRFVRLLPDSESWVEYLEGNKPDF